MRQSTGPPVHWINIAQYQGYCTSLVHVVYFTWSKMFRFLHCVAAAVCEGSSPAPSRGFPPP